MPTARPIPTTAQPAHPPIVVSRTHVSPPSTTVSAFIGAAQAKLSLGTTKEVPGMQTVQAAVAQGPANHVPTPVSNALQTYMKTPQCATAIANARLIAEYTVAKMNGKTPTPPKLASPAINADVAAATRAAIATVGKQRRNVSTHDQVTAYDAVVAIFCPEAAAPLEAINQLLYVIWGDDGVNAVFGPPDTPASPFIKSIYDDVKNFGGSTGTSDGGSSGGSDGSDGSDGSGGSGKKPGDDDDPALHPN